MKRGFISNEQKSGRSLSHGKIASLATAFRLKNGSPFSIVIIPKNCIDVDKVTVISPILAEGVAPKLGLLVNCTMYEDDAAEKYYVSFLWPSDGLFFEISNDAIDLDDYDVYWSCQNEDEPLIES